MDIFLCSTSPRRREILKNLLGEIRIIAPSGDEKVRNDENPKEFTQRVSREKIESVKRAVPPHGQALFIASDTVVVAEGNILGKPAGYDDAVRMMRMLSGKWHRVITGVALCCSDENGIKVFSDYEMTSVKFKNLSEQEISMYLERIEYRDKAGSYAIQESGELIIEKIDGSYSNVIGFPLRKFISMLAGLDMIEKVFFDYP